MPSGLSWSVNSCPERAPDLRHQEGQGLGVGGRLMLAHADQYKHH